MLITAIFATVTISIHSLRVEGDRKPTRRALQAQRFQSTPSAWRETRTAFIIFYLNLISIHSLRVEGDKSFIAD